MTAQFPETVIRLNASNHPFEQRIGPRPRLAGRLLHQLLMFLGPYVDGFVDQQHRDPVVNSVGLVQAGVVEDVADQQEGSTVDRAHQDAEKSLVQHCGYGVVGRMTGGAGAAGIPGALAWGACGTTLAGFAAPGAAPAPITAPLAFLAWELCRICICAWIFS